MRYFLEGLIVLRDWEIWEVCVYFKGTKREHFDEVVFPGGCWQHVLVIIISYRGRMSYSVEIMFHRGLRVCVVCQGHVGGGKRGDVPTGRVCITCTSHSVGILYSPSNLYERPWSHPLFI